MWLHSKNFRYFAWRVFLVINPKRRERLTAAAVIINVISFSDNILSNVKAMSLPADSTLRLRG